MIGTNDLTMFCDYCPVPDRLYFVPFDVPVVAFMVLPAAPVRGIDQGIITTQQAHLAMQVFQYGDDRQSQMSYAWHAPSRTLFVGRGPA